MTSWQVIFKDLFYFQIFFNISRTNSLISKVNQQSVLNILTLHNFPAFDNRF